MALKSIAEKLMKVLIINTPVNVEENSKSMSCFF